MGKKQRASQHIDFESDNEELQDEIDKFHDDRTAIDQSVYRRTKRTDVHEVLNVEGDTSGEEMDGQDDESDFEEEVAVNKWGNQRSQYYGTGYVDEDYGGMREEEIERAELEEDDAVARQKYFDKIAASVTDIMGDDDDDEAIQDKSKVEVSEQWCLKSAKKYNKNYKTLLTEYSQRAELMSVIVQPLAEIVNKLPSNSVLAKQITLAVEIYANYLMTMLIVLKEKSASFALKKLTDDATDSHPALGKLTKLKSMITEVDSFLEHNSVALQKLQTAQSAEDVTKLLTDLKIHVPVKKSKKIEQPSVESVAQQGEIAQEGEEELDENGEKRPALGFIAKNSDKVKKRKNKCKIAKTANRKRFKKLSGKVRSQVGVIRKETTKYQGETRGIKKGLIRSTKLIA